MYYGKYDYYLFAEKCVELTPSASNINQEISYKISQLDKEYSYTKSGFLNLRNMKNISDINNTYVYGIDFYNILFKKEGLCKYSQEVSETLKTFHKKIVDFEIDNLVFNLGTFPLLYINDILVNASYSQLPGKIRVAVTSEISNIIKVSNNKFTFMEVKKESPNILGFNSCNFTTRSQFFNMESLEGSFDYKKAHTYIKDYGVQSDNGVNKTIKEKKYTITIIEPEYQDSLLHIFKNSDIIKLVKMYPDRVEEFYNCTLDKENEISEEQDVNKRTYEISCTDIFIRYFDSNNENLLSEGGIFID